MPTLAFGDMNSMIVLDANDEYRSYMLENIDLKLLRMFSVVARVGSFTRSAMLIDVTQSSVSHGIKRLESQLGCSLFYKKGKSIHLTPEGRFFLGHVQRLLDLYDRTIESVGKRFQEGAAQLKCYFCRLRGLFHPRAGAEGISRILSRRIGHRSPGRCSASPEGRGRRQYRFGDCGRRSLTQ